jgi:hypothetical protein
MSAKKYMAITGASKPRPRAIYKTWPRKASSSPPAAAEALITGSTCDLTTHELKRTGFARSNTAYYLRLADSPHHSLSLTPT